ncbi:hypothetical protein N9V07_03270 [Candidatus Pelagibacter sp.]|nr:hypothetical protein [Candidatus Pelagibacter sp.]
MYDEWSSLLIKKDELIVNMNTLIGFGTMGEGFIPFVLILSTSVGAFVWLIKNKKLEIYTNKLEKFWLSKGLSKFAFEIIMWIMIMIVWSGILGGAVYAFYLLGVVD